MLGELYSIGHSNQSFEQFLEMLQSVGVQAVADVRSVPVDISTPQFNPEILQHALKSNGIIYLPFGEEFGAQCTIRGTERIQNGLNKGYKIALLCSEANPLENHRYTISCWFDEHGIKVCHIVRDEKGKVIVLPHVMLQEANIQERLRKLFATDKTAASTLVSDTQTISPYALAEDFALRSNRCIFLTGKAGTGKTTFLKHLRECSSKNMAVVAPTGVAAINAGGMTIHSLFQLPVRTLIPTPQSYRQIFTEQRLTQRKRNMLYNLEMLVIDEISMVRADVLDAIDAVLRHYKYRRDLPFGGVQVLMIGDLMQLSPVVTNDDKVMMNKYYDSPYFFSSKVMHELQPIYIELDHVFRQQNEEFVNLLNEVRDNRLTDKSRQLLSSRYIPYFTNTNDDFHITLTTHNYAADMLNKNKLDALHGKVMAYEAEVKGNFPESSYPADAVLELKIGARVMFIRNDDQKPRRFFNGKLGIVTALDGSKVVVSCDDGEFEVEPMVWENIRYREDEQTGKITEEMLGSFAQIPLRLAWAITIHKSQGLTFDKVIIDAERAFAAGQVYVALSRCRTLDGIVLTSPLERTSLAQERGVIEYVNSQPTILETAQSLRVAKQDYLQQILLDLFGFHRSQVLMEQMQNLVNSTVSFNADTPLFLMSLRPRIDALITVAQSFSAQLVGILNTGDYQLLQQRLGAAADYFCPRMQMIASQISTQPCRSKNKSDAADYMVFAMELFVALHQKIVFMRALAQEVTVDKYLDAKQHFVAPPLQVSSVLLKPEKKEKNIRKEKTPKPTKERKPKVDTFALTFDMLQKGNSIEDIARMRSLTVNTIYGHVVRLIAAGKLRADNFVSAEIYQRIKNAFEAHPEFTMTDFYNLFVGEIDYNTIRIVLAELQKSI